jgi:2-succinyl-6-hydroxy-2,4-cyclohexadiene-1-carboxylate synthase
MGPSQGVPVLFLHGFTGSAEAWGEAILEGLARHRRVLVVDLPGHGEAPGPRPDSGYSVDGVLAALGALLDAEGAPQADWVGYSMGGRLALAAAVRHPERVRRLVLESASPGLATEDARARRRRQDEQLARRLETQGMEAFVAFWMNQPLFASQHRLPQIVLDDARRRRLRGDPFHLAAALRGLGTGSQPSFWANLSTVRQPALILTGALDATYTRIGADMARQMPQAQHVILPSLGHTLHLEGPRAWLETVRPFLVLPEEDAAKERPATERSAAEIAPDADPQDPDSEVDVDVDVDVDELILPDDL